MVKRGKIEPLRFDKEYNIFSKDSVIVVSFYDIFLNAFKKSRTNKDQFSLDNVKN